MYKRQELSGRLVELGIKGFLNFSHYDRSVPYPEVVVENVHLGDSLMSQMCIRDRHGRPCGGRCRLCAADEDGYRGPAVQLLSLIHI